MSAVETDAQLALRCIGHALTLNDADGWLSVSVVMGQLLPASARGGMAAAALRTLREDDATDVAVMVLGHAGYPLPPSLHAVDDARHWVAFASMKERKAFLVAIWDSLDPPARARFLRYAEGRR